MKAYQVGNHRDSEIYQVAFSAAMETFDLSKNFPEAERETLWHFWSFLGRNARRQLNIDLLNMIDEPVQQVGIDL